MKSEPVRRAAWSAAIASVVSLAQLTSAQPPDANYDEDKVPKYELPDPLKYADGSDVLDAADWRWRRRPELIDLFREHMFGRAPGRPEKLSFEVIETGAALGGKAVRKQIVIRCGHRDRSVQLNLLLYTPARKSSGTPSHAPVFLGLNFWGNHTIATDPKIELARIWVRNSKAEGVSNNRATETSRGMSRSRWPVEMLISRGCALATMYYGDVDPDFDDGFGNGVHGLFRGAGDEKRRPDAWGSIAAWAWGLSRALDYLETDPHVDAHRVAVVGHSRLGKTALWAGADDDRFAMVVSNDSGCGGAALSRRRYGETVARITKVFPHWFCENFRGFADRESALPFDQHTLISLIAPRPVLICSAVEDRWADPKGEFLSALNADAAYRLLGTDGMAAEQMPQPDQLIVSRVGYHIRPGRHDMKLADWQSYVRFAAHHGLLRPPPTQTQRAEFAKKLAMLKEDTPRTTAIEILGPPDETWGPKRGIHRTKQILCYGSTLRSRFPSLGRVYIDEDDRVQLVVGQKAFRPIGLGEPALRRHLERIDDCSVDYSGSRYHPKPVLDLVNELRALGKDRALDLIDEYLRVTSTCHESARPGLFLVLRVLFDVPDDPGYHPEMFVGKMTPQEPEDRRIFPRFPIAIVDDVPLLLVQSYRIGGEAESVEAHAEHFRKHGILRQNPLRPQRRNRDTTPSRAFEDLEAKVVEHMKADAGTLRFLTRQWQQAHSR